LVLAPRDGASDAEALHAPAAPGRCWTQKGGRGSGGRQSVADVNDGLGELPGAGASSALEGETVISDGQEDVGEESFWCRSHLVVVGAVESADLSVEARDDFGVIGAAGLLEVVGDTPHRLLGDVDIVATVQRVPDSQGFWLNASLLQVRDRV